MTSVVGAYYYLRIVKVMYFDEAGRARTIPCRPGVKLVLALTQRLRACSFWHRSWPAGQRQPARLRARCCSDREPVARDRGRRLSGSSRSSATDSTNDDALQAAPLRAIRDSSGSPQPSNLSERGRHGRQWSSPPGQSLCQPSPDRPCARCRRPQLGFVAGLALHEAIEAVTGVGAPRLSLKWPNDLLLDGAKVSGLLLEGHRPVQWPAGHRHRLRGECGLRSDRHALPGRPLCRRSRPRL